MKTSKMFAIAALSLAALTGAVHAEEYQGVLDPVSVLSRSEVHQQAVATAHSPNQNIPANAVSMGALQSSRSRADVRAEAAAAARDGTLNLDPSAFVENWIPAQLQAGTTTTQRAGL